MKLFDRKWRVTVDTLQLTDIDIEFQVKRTLKPEPNTCDLKLYNLTLAHRKQIEQSPAILTLKKVPVSIEAGYKDDMAQIFKGELRAGSSTTKGADIVTELTTGDGEKGMATARLNVPLGPGTLLSTAIAEIVTTLGVGKGNIAEALAKLNATGMFSAKGVVLKGNAAQHLTDVCKSVGLEWSIQEGAVQFLTLGQPLDGQALVLNSSTGLVGSPSVDSKGVLTAMCLMIPGVKPGQKISIEGEHVRGTYKLSVCEYEGDTFGNNWYIKIQAETVK